MTLTSSLIRVLFGLGSVLVTAMVMLLAVPALAGPGQPDPRQMSGIPRPDPQIPAGEVTVRVLRGSFEEPALDAVVELELRSADGRVAELRSATAGNQGRAHFRELGPFLGGQAVARVSLDGEVIRSHQIDLRPDTGTAVMLVKGAPKGSASQEMSLPGIVFDFDKTPAGTLMVGVFDLGSRQGLIDVEVHLDVTSPDGQTTTKTLESGAMGQATFDGLAELPPGAVLQVRAQLAAEGEPYRSMEFVNEPMRGQAVVLAKGRMAPDGGNPHQGGTPGQASQGPTKLPGPRIARELPPGTVQVLVVDGRDQPLADQPLFIVKKGFDGTKESYPAKTTAEGIVLRSGLPVVEDALYYVAVTYDGAPYTSPFFGLDGRGGVRLAMRVWPVTSDPAVAKSAVQWEVMETENDHAQVVQVYEVLVGGDKAYWPDEPLRIRGIEGAKGLVVLRGADDWLEHDDDKAPYATLSQPIPPGGVAALSVGYVVEHDGALEFDWPPPFEVIESAVVLKESMTLEAPGATRSDRELPPQAGLDYARVAYDLGQKGRGALQLRVEGLLRTPRLYRQLGIGVGLMMLVVLVAGLARTRSGDTRARLTKRRDELLAALERGADERERTRIITALDRIYRQLDALDALGRKTTVTAQPRPPVAGA
ncbi:hypothetical protein [Paraliomyxa miuraensis]|uniref:hypothetical protein n=1 Tax=Paraliomyxa miuraensis TaxID=376150 RepID=UPI0022511105|nr:hypothetical protein [Paraliomyxa miuraensis]MCX4239847.1 hypothetical protein [Paraliomyxa miuraensis]